MTKNYAIIQSENPVAEMAIDLDSFDRLIASGGPLKPSTAHDVDALSSILRPVFTAMAYQRDDDGSMTATILSIFDVDDDNRPTLQTLTRLYVGAPDSRGEREAARDYFRS